MAQGTVTEELMEESLHVLLVEDDPMMRHAVVRALHSAGENLRIHEEANGESAISLLSSAHFDCVFLDYQLPAMDGLEVGVTKAEIQAHMELNTRRDGDEFETRFRTKSGEVRDILLRVRPLRLPGKIYLHGILQDITERNRLKEQLVQSQKMEAIGRLAGGIAHDFNNLLAIISGYAESLTRRLGDENLRSHASEIQNAAERGGALTRQLLAFGRRQVVRPERMNLNTCIAGMNEMLGRLLSRETFLKLNLDENLPNIEADLGQMEQVI